MVESADLLELYASLRRAMALRANEVFKEIGLGSRQFIILYSLKCKHEMTVGDLVEASMTDAATVSRSLVQLCEAGFIEKIRSPDDGRVWIVKLTKKGWTLAPKMERLFHELADRSFGVLAVEERRQLATLLAKLVCHLKEDSHLDAVVEV